VTLILASSSPRRAALLGAAGFVFSMAPAEVDERQHPGEDPREYVARLARAKAAAGGADSDGAFVLGADTTVVIESEVLGKPADAVEAAAMLRKLSGRTHEVLTGISVRRGSQRAESVEATQVHVAALSPAEISWYLSTGEYRGKAGAYAIQGLASRFVTGIDGSYANVVGLPVATVYRLLRQLGYED
jgi:septum formation protein